MILINPVPSYCQLMSSQKTITHPSLLWLSKPAQKAYFFLLSPAKSETYRLSEPHKSKEFTLNGRYFGGYKRQSRQRQNKVNYAWSAFYKSISIIIFCSFSLFLRVSHIGTQRETRKKNGMPYYGAKKKSCLWGFFLRGSEERESKKNHTNIY